MSFIKNSKAKYILALSSLIILLPIVGIGVTLVLLTLDKHVQISTQAYRRFYRFFAIFWVGLIFFILANPYYDLERLGIYFVASPRHADVMLLSGVMTFNMTPHVKDAYEQMPEPKWVITMGDCPAMEGVFEKTYAINAPVNNHIPIAYHIKGCPPSPKEIMIGILEFLKKM